MRAPSETEVEQLAALLRARFAIGKWIGRHLVRELFAAWLQQCERAPRKEGKSDGRVGE